jgi:hypothetical protein
MSASRHQVVIMSVRVNNHLYLLVKRDNLQDFVWSTHSELGRYKEKGYTRFNKDLKTIKQLIGD